MIKIIKEPLKKTRLMINKIGCKKRTKKLKTEDFSIISNNCYSGIVYQWLGKKYNTPTIGLYFYADEYIKFLQRFDYYITKKLTFIKTSDSKYYSELKELGYENKIIGCLEDVEIVFLHYKTESEAKQKWEKRCKRLSKNLIFKFNDTNQCTEEHLKAFNDLPYKNKICFTSKKTKYNDFIQIKKYVKYEEIKEDYYSGHKYFDIIKYINDKFTKKRVLHIIPTYNYSGAENVAITIIKELSNKYDFVYSSYTGTTKDFLKKDNIRFKEVKTFKIKEIKKIIKEINPDIIHAHDYKATCICVFTGTKVPIISHLHNNSPWLKKYGIYSFVLLISSFFVKKILTVSESIENEYVFSKFIKNKIECINNPVSYKKISSSVNQANKKNKYDICCVGRLSEQKNPYKFIAVIEQIKKKQNDVKAVWVGEGYLKDKLLEIVKEKKLEKNIKFVGFKNNPYEYIYDSKVFILTSDWEGYGLVAYEAIALGVPVIVSNVGGLPKIVDSSCGALCKSIDEFCDAYFKIIKSNSYNIYVLNAIKKAKKMDNIKKYTEKIEKIYEEVSVK